MSEEFAMKPKSTHQLVVHELKKHMGVEPGCPYCTPEERAMSFVLDLVSLEGDEDRDMPADILSVAKDIAAAQAEALAGQPESSVREKEYEHGCPECLAEVSADGEYCKDCVSSAPWVRT